MSEKCPVCGSTNITKAVFLWCYFKCKCLDCGHTWSDFKVERALAFIGATLFGIGGAIWVGRKNE